MCCLFLYHWFSSDCIYIADQEEAFMKAWLNMIQERNVLVRRTQELSLQMKVLELEDRQYELEKTMRDLQTGD